jgi:P4 family phage/plasmid primase-like protien
MPTKLDLFLNGNPTGKTDQEKNGRKVTESGKPFTLWSFENKEKWMITSDDQDEFYKLYYANLLNGIPMHYTEKSTPIGQLRIDLDFKYDGQVNEHKHTQDQVLSFVKAYMEEVRKFIHVDDTVEIFVLEKDYPTFNKAKNISSSGIHIQVPSIKTRPSVEQSIRRNLLSRMNDFFPGLELRDDWDKVYDKSPLTHTNNWPLLGSKKPGDESLPYKIRYIIDWEDGNTSVDNDVSPVPTLDFIRRLSVRSPSSDESELTDYGKENTRDVPAEAQPQTRPVSRGRSNTRDPVNSRTSSPGRYKEPLSEMRMSYIRDHVMNLDIKKRCVEYDDWVKVGMCLKNIHTDLEDVWHDFSKQIDTLKPNTYKPAECNAKWDSFGFRVDGEVLGEGSLRFWSREDNYEHYLEIERNNVDRLVDESAATGTEYDVASVVYTKYRDEFKCSSYLNNEWYHYVDHIWKSSERGVELLRRLSSDIAKLYMEKQTHYGKELMELPSCSHKDHDPSCDTCMALKKQKQYMALYMKLRTTAFKNNVMKECQALMFDKDFAKKLDDNKHLIAFKNGVFDTLTQTFREGRMDDYISFCTNVDYNLSTQYYQYSCWNELHQFLERVLPNPNVRIYFLKHLATCLSGEFQPRFHIMTGTGSNGKSMIMNLMATAMGDYCYKVNVAVFTQKRAKVGSAQPEYARMRGKRFVMMSEPDEGEPLSTGVLKELTSNEKITCRDLFQGSKQMMEFDVQAKFHLACNDKPTVNTNDGGTWRRLKVIHFPSKFVHTPDPTKPHEYLVDETIQRKVLSEEWATCFMSYLVHLYTEGKGLRGLVPPPEVEAYTNEYKEDSDLIAQFMREFIHPVESELPEGTPWNKIAADFEAWKRSHGAMNVNVNQLKKKLIETYGTPRHRVGFTRFRYGD